MDAPRILSSELLNCAASDSRSLQIQLIDMILELIFGHGDGSGIKGVRLDDVGAGLEIFTVNGLDDVRLRDVQDVVIEAKILGMPRKLLAAVVRFRELTRLDHRPHGAIEDDDPLLQEFPELIRAIVSGIQE